jgi:hypothetical protein
MSCQVRRFGVGQHTNVILARHAREYPSQRERQGFTYTTLYALPNISVELVTDTNVNTSDWQDQLIQRAHLITHPTALLVHPQFFPCSHIYLYAACLHLPHKQQASTNPL